MKSSSQCAALVIAAPASGQGKTTITSALAWHYRQQGKKVRVFKVGPDFLDPMILQHASGNTVYQLDLWMVGEQACRQLLAEAATQADIILIEGVMGLFDGDPSTADLAACLGIPVLAVIDASAMAQTFAALAYGLAHYRQDVNVAAVVANRIGSDRHYQMLIGSLPEDLPCYAALKRQKADLLPSRHLGLVQAKELADLDQRLDHLVEQLQLNEQFELPKIDFSKSEQSSLTPSLAGVSIAVARDLAFSFIYQANLDLLQQLGARLLFFSPLEDHDLPDCDSLYLPGGYPELHLTQLANNHSMHTAINVHYQSGKPIVAECGGMLYLTESLTDKKGQQAQMLGLLSGHAVLQARLTALALQQVSLDGQTIRGHTYHHSTLETDAKVVSVATNPNGTHCNEAVYQQGRLTATYIHFYFPSNPAAITALFLP